mgnify:CR=1 FL=1
MKRLLFILTFLSITFANAQAYFGAGDNKLTIAANMQDRGTGINLTYDLGLGPNISMGLSGTYVLGYSSSLDAYDISFGDRIDIKGRFNANLGEVIAIDPNFDVYPGLNIGLKNFGGHLGMRYFFSEGFGLAAEALFPIAKYKDNLNPAEKLHNQFNINFGAVFNL